MVKTIRVPTYRVVRYKVNGKPRVRIARTGVRIVRLKRR